MSIVIDYDRRLPPSPSEANERAVYTCSDGKTIKYVEAYKSSLGLRWTMPVEITIDEYNKLLGYD